MRVSPQREQHQNAMDVIAQVMAKLTADVNALSQHIVRLKGQAEEFRNNLDLAVG